jgi:molybdopterin molybdotransferase
VFHRLPIKPGKPVLGAVTSNGKLIVGLPGNPVSVAVTATAVALPLLRYMAGFSAPLLPRPKVLVDDFDDQQLPLMWYRLVEIAADGRVSLMDSRGSGDLVSLARSSGFVALPAGMSGAGPWPLYLW